MRQFGCAKRFAWLLGVNTEFWHKILSDRRQIDLPSNGVRLSQQLLCVCPTMQKAYCTSLWNKPESRSNGLLNALWPSTVKIVFLAMLTVAWNKLVFLTDLLGPVSKKFSSGYHPYMYFYPFPPLKQNQKHTSSCRFYFCDSLSTLQYDIFCKPAKYNNFILFWNSVIQYVLKKKIYKLFKKQMQIFVSN